jgi:hypothetical protein
VIPLLSLPPPPLLLLQLQVEAVADAPKTLTLDTRDLTLHKVTLLSGSTAAAAAAAAVTEEKGSAEQSLQYVLAEKHQVSACLPTNTARGFVCCSGFVHCIYAAMVP